MEKLISCEYNFDNCCVELKFTDGSMIAIDTIAVENEVARNIYERSELDYLIHNASLEYTDLILNGDPEAYLSVFGTVISDVLKSAAESGKIRCAKHRIGKKMQSAVACKMAAIPV